MNALQSLAKVYANNNKELMLVLRKYGYKGNSINEVIDFISLNSNNQKFDKELTALFVKKGKFTKKDTEYKSFVTLLIGAATTIASLTGQYVQNKKEKKLAEEQAKIEAERLLAEEKAKIKQRNIIIASVSGVLVLGVLTYLIVK